MEVDTPLEEQVAKTSEAIQGLHTKTTNLEAHQKRSTQPQEREKREKMMTTTIEKIKGMEVECTKLYKERTKVWTQPIEEMKL
jgi:hypothetical protein